MKTAAVYIRVSTDDQGEHSPDSQLREAKEYAKRHNMIIDPQYIYTDAGISGRHAKKRPAFQKMIATAKDKPSPFDTILVWKFSRFARNQEESILYKSLLRKECNVEVISITEETGDSMFGSLIERIIEWMDEFYSLRLSEEVRTKMTFVAEKGVVQSIAPFGYSKKHDQPMVINEDEAKWVKYIFESFVAGKSLLGIARELNNNGVRTHRGNQFDNRGIEYILYNPMYIGYVRWTPSGKTLSKRIYDSPDTMIVKGDFEPIISEELFYLAKQEMENRKKTRKRYDKPTDVKKHWLSGLVKCSSCGATLAYSPKNDGFQCYKYAKGICKESHFIKAAKLEEAVILAIQQTTIDDRFIADNTLLDKPQATIDFSKQLSKLEAMLGRAKLAFVEGIDTLEEYSANKKRIQAEIDEIKFKQEERKETVTYASSSEVSEKFKNIVSLLREEEDKNVKNRAISSIVEKVEFSKVPESIKVYFYL